MFCPECKDEYRPGFTRCATCNVDLVQSLAAGASKPAAAKTGAGSLPAGVPLPSMAEYCGFVALDEARRARDVLRTEAIGSEIVIRESAQSPPDGPAVEEYWLRVDRNRYRDVVRLLGYDEAAAEVEADEEEVEDNFDCGACGGSVAADERFCPHCGARFEDD
jgi:hypothetical protein